MTITVWVQNTTIQSVIQIYYTIILFFLNQVHGFRKKFSIYLLNLIGTILIIYSTENSRHYVTIYTKIYLLI